MAASQRDVTTPRLHLMWGHLRNLMNFTSVEIPGSVRLVGTVCGEFPVDAHNPVFLEVAKEYKREDLSGRFNCSGSVAGQVLYTNYWHPVRAVPLPRFDTDPDLTLEELCEGYSHLLDDWHGSFIPDNLPCAAVALKFHGNYSDEREAQRIAVLLLYPNRTARTMFLDFFEGAMDDCISPEWYLSVTMLESIETAISGFRKMATIQPDWDRTYSSVFIKPNFLGNFLVRGRERVTSERKWESEWTYAAHQEFVLDSTALLDKVQGFFTGR